MRESIRIVDTPAFREIYERYVRRMSYALLAEQIGYEQALGSLRNLATWLGPALTEADV